MSLESPLPAPVVNLTEVVMPEHGEVVRPPEPQPPPSAEQVQAVEAVFAAKERESEQVAGLLGMWAGIALLHDVAVETFTRPAGAIDGEEGKKKKVKDEET